MYTLVSAVIGVTFGFAFSNEFVFYKGFLVAFFISFFLLTFIHTLARGTNVMFFLACRVFLAMAPLFFLWFIYGLPGVVFVLLGIVGGFVTAPVWYFVSIVRKEVTRNVALSIMIALLAILICTGAILFIKPIWVYSLVGYGWIIALNIIVPIVVILISIFLKASWLISGKMLKRMIIASALCIPLMIFGILFSRNRTYEIYTAWDMRAFGNAPNSYETVFILQNDIDFEGKDVSWLGKQELFDGIFEGGGYTLSNIKCEVEAERYDINGEGPFYNFGFVGTNNGIIKNLNFENCSFVIDSYNGENNDTAYIGILAAYNAKNGRIYNCTLKDCYAKYYRYQYTDYWDDIHYQSTNAGYIVGSYTGGEDSKFDPQANKVIITGEWKPDEKFFEKEENWLFITKEIGG